MDLGAEKPESSEIVKQRGGCQLSATCWAKRVDLTAESPRARKLSKNVAAGGTRRRGRMFYTSPTSKYDGLGGVIGTLRRVRYPVQDGIVRGELSVSGG